MASVMRFATAVLAVLGLASQLSAQSRATEYQVKAAYISHFSKFVEWSPSAPIMKTFNICVLGQDPFGAALDAAIAGETVGRVPLTAKRIVKPQDALDCRVLFVSSSEDRHCEEILEVVKTFHVLTVSDMREFTKRGGIVQFVLEGNKVRFEVNLAAAEPSKLKLSSELLKLAVNVRREP